MNTFGGFPFDEEVFTQFMTEQAPWRNELMVSQAVVEDSTILGMLGDKGNIATIPFYKPISLEDYTPENYDGETDQNPKSLSGGAQTCVMTGRMQSWSAASFGAGLTGADPIGYVGGQVNGYYQQLWEDLMFRVAVSVLGISGLSSHITSIALSGAGVPDATNKHDAETLINAKQKAFGDMADDSPGLLFMHSKVYANYQKLKLVDYEKYTVTDALGKTHGIPSIGGDLVRVRDRGTVFTANGNANYRTFLFGPGAFLTARKGNIDRPYYVDYDPKTDGGTDLLYTKEARVLHPNGVSFDPTGMAKKSPTDTELTTTANWTLKYDEKNVKISSIVSNG